MLTHLLSVFWLHFNAAQCFAEPKRIQQTTLLSYEPRHDKNNKRSVPPAKTQISLGICPVWPESSLSAWRKIGSLATHWAHREDTAHSEDWADAQADLSLRWAHSFCWFCHVAAHIYVPSTTVWNASYLEKCTSQIVSLLILPFVQIIKNKGRDMTKPTKWLCAQRRLRSAWASAQSDQRLRCPHEESLGP